jgi:thiol-disulfide isomerase/thioredoxin
MRLTIKNLAFVSTLFLIIVFLFSSFHSERAPNAVFVTLEGNKISIDSLKGKVVLVNFWASDCKSCIEEMPALINTYNNYKKKGFEVIAVAMPYDPPAQVLNYALQKKLPFPVMHDGLSDITTKFGNINLTPTTFIYDKSGKQIAHFQGAIDFKMLKETLNKELG